MAISRKRKEELVAQYVELINQSRAVFMTEYTGLDVKQLQKLRGEVRKVNGSYHITKNTLMLQALAQSGRPAPADLLTGQLATGFALSEAPALAKTLSDFAKEEELFSIKFGILGDEVLTGEQIKELASLPSLDELRAQLLGLIQTPARQIAATLAAGVRQVVNVLDAYAKLEDEAVEPAE